MLRRRFSQARQAGAVLMAGVCCRITLLSRWSSAPLPRLGLLGTACDQLHQCYRKVHHSATGTMAS